MVMATASPTAAPPDGQQFLLCICLSQHGYGYTITQTKESPGSARQLIKHFDEKTGTTKALETAACLNSLGSKRALDMALPGCSKTPCLPVFPTSSMLGSLGRLTLALEAPARLLWARARHLGYVTAYYFHFFYFYNLVHQV